VHTCQEYVTSEEYLTSKGRRGCRRLSLLRPLPGARRVRRRLWPTRVAPPTLAYSCCAAHSGLLVLRRRLWPTRVAPPTLALRLRPRRRWSAAATTTGLPTAAQALQLRRRRPAGVGCARKRALLAAAKEAC